MNTDKPVIWGVNKIRVIETMLKLSPSTKEEIFKNVIDKLIFGLLASIILFGMQKCAEKYDREQIKKQAILQIESQYIMEGAGLIKNEFSLYLIEVSRFIKDEVPLDNDQRVRIVNHHIKLESEIEAISAHHISLIEEGDLLLKAVDDLNERVIGYSDGNTEQYRKELTGLKKRNQKFLSVLKKAAILALSKD